MSKPEPPSRAEVARRMGIPRKHVWGARYQRMIAMWEWGVEDAEAHRASSHGARLEAALMNGVSQSEVRHATERQQEVQDAESRQQRLHRPPQREPKAIPYAKRMRSGPF